MLNKNSILKKISLLAIAAFGISLVVSACHNQQDTGKCPKCDKEDPHLETVVEQNKPIKVGEEAPKFHLKNSEDEMVSLEDFKGKPVLLYFYPKDDTPACTKEACTIRDNYSKFKEFDIKVLGLSADSVESHAKFRKKYHLPFELLSDNNKEVTKAYKANGIFIKRISYLIDKNGTILKIYNNVKPSEHAEEILQDYQKLRKEELETIKI